jgi:hypothetical protein
MQITISEAITNLKLLRERHAELLSLRNQNAIKENRFYGANAERTKEVEPVYDVKKLDALVTRIAGEMRKLDAAIKKANATTPVEYDWNDGVFGQVE